MSATGLGRYFSRRGPVLEASLVSLILAVTIVPVMDAASLSPISVDSLVTPVDDCRSYKGDWEQTHFSSSNASNATMREAGDVIRLVITSVADDCTFEATFNAEPTQPPTTIRHSLTGRIGESRDAGSLKTKRTDPQGCTITLFGSMYVIKTPVLGMGYIKNLAWVINGNEPGCGMSPSYTEIRWFKRAGHSM